MKEERGLMSKGSINKAILIGNLGSDPELRSTPSGVQVANFSLATTESWTDKSGERQERTEWHRVVIWRRLAEVVGQYLKKGSKIYIEAHNTREGAASVAPMAGGGPSDDGLPF